MWATALGVVLHFTIATTIVAVACFLARRFLSCSGTLSLPGPLTASESGS
jgi:hypothetical protein